MAISPLFRVACALLAAGAALDSSEYKEITSFTIPRSPSGLFYHALQDLLYILCGTNTNGDHYIYAYTTNGTQECLITIPEAVGMSRVDGFYIDGQSAYIADSQGPIYASEPGRLGGSVYVVDWNDPCSCGHSVGSSCRANEVEWRPNITRAYNLSATQLSIADGGGNDNFFRNSGVVVSGEYFYAVDGVHPNPNLTCCYPKSLVKVSLDNGSVVSKWSFTASTLGHDVDMEGMSCGADGCANYLYVGDEYNYIYKLNLATSDPAAAVEAQWSLGSIVLDVPDDKGIESLAYAPSTGYFYAGIQWTSVIHVLQLFDPVASGSTSAAAPGEATTSMQTFISTTDSSGSPWRTAPSPCGTALLLPALLVRLVATAPEP